MTEKRLVVFTRQRAEISTTEIVLSKFHSAHILPLKLPSEPGFISHCIFLSSTSCLQSHNSSSAQEVLPWEATALPGSLKHLSSTSPLTAHPRWQKPLWRNFSAQGTSVSIRDLYPIAFISILLLFQRTHKKSTGSVLLLGAKFSLTQSFISLLLCLKTDCPRMGWRIVSTD